MTRASKAQREKCKYRGHARTPIEFVRHLESYYEVVFTLDAMGDDLDDWHVCERYYTIDDNALAPCTSWACSAAFCNPPFDTKTYMAACLKAAEEVHRFACSFACIILPASVLSNKPFYEHVFKHSIKPPDSITIWTPRVNFQHHPLSQMYLDAVAEGREPKGQANGVTMTLGYRQDASTPREPIIRLEKWK